MPIYEYRCEPCDHDFEALIRGRGDDDSARCPRCGAVDVAKRFSAPAAARAAGGSPGASPMPAPPMGGGCGMGGCGMGGCSAG